MLSDLKRAHETLLACLDELEKLAEANVPDPAKLASVRWKLSRASGERRKLVEAACDLLLNSANAIDRNRAAALRGESAELIAASSRHVGRWTMDEVLADLVGYREASAAMRKSMRARIAQEQRALYPLLERAAA
ncbi:hypothetical protein [Sphingomonas sp. MS122]|uniref:hypothetical protein n=1 Tax=Sphingomonas sp. MS122 TaxID=3412683 RepID=UPI003C2E2558